MRIITKSVEESAKDPALFIAQLIEVSHEWSSGKKREDRRYLKFEDNQIEKVYEIDDASKLPKEEWERILSGRRLNSYRESTVTIKYIKASSGSTFKLFYEPQKSPGTLTLGDIKNDLSNLGVKIVTTQKDHYYPRYGNAINYYEMIISEEYKDQVEGYVADAHNRADIGFKRPDRNSSASDLLKVPSNDAGATETIAHEHTAVDDCEKSVEESCGGKRVKITTKRSAKEAASFSESLEEKWNDADLNCDRDSVGSYEFETADQAKKGLEIAKSSGYGKAFRVGRKVSLESVSLGQVDGAAVGGGGPVPTTDFRRDFEDAAKRLKEIMKIGDTTTGDGKKIKAEQLDIQPNGTPNPAKDSEETQKKETKKANESADGSELQGVTKSAKSATEMGWMYRSRAVNANDYNNSTTPADLGRYLNAALVKWKKMNDEHISTDEELYARVRGKFVDVEEDIEENLKNTTLDNTSARAHSRDYLREIEEEYEYYQQDGVPDRVLQLFKDTISRLNKLLNSTESATECIHPKVKINTKRSAREAQENSLSSAEIEIDRLCYKLDDLEYFIDDQLTPEQQKIFGLSTLSSSITLAWAKIKAELMKHYPNSPILRKWGLD